MAKTTESVSFKDSASILGVESVFEFLNSMDLSELNENTEETLKGVISIIAECFGADHGYIIIKGQGDRPADVVDIHRDGLDNSLVTASYTVIDSVMETGQGQFVTDAMNSEQFQGDPCFQRFNINKVICSAIKTDESVSGVIYIDSNKSECKWDNRHLTMLDLTCQFLGLSTQNIHLRAAKDENKRLVAAGKATLQLSHSVKNVLQMVIGAAEVIDFGLRSNEIHRVKRSWDILKPNIERLKKFTLDMLDYSKERKLELGACDFNRIIQGSIESLKTQLKRKKIKLLIRVDQNMPTVELDSERIHEMALNLILNAIDIVDDATGVVNIETRYIKKAQEVELTITDNGPGMTEEIIETIFRPFESEKNKFGTGLGMPIAKQVIDQHSGRIEVDSEEGKGATFRVYLPAKVVE